MKKDGVLSLIVVYLKIIVGAALYAAGFQFFLYQNSIVAGGVTGVAMIVNYLTGIPVGIMSIIINIPLFAFAWKKFGLKFILASLVGMLLSSVLVDMFALVTINITNESLLASIYGGVVKGFGLGLVYSSGGTTGGIDIVAKFLRRKYPYINFGTLLLLLDVAVIMVFAVLFGEYNNSMYAIIAMFIASKVIDLVLYGAVNSKLCYIITDSFDEIKNAIVQRMGRGVTLLHGHGAYTGKEKQVILCVIKHQQIVEFRKLINSIDEKSFVVVTNSREVFGNGFSSIADFD